MQKALILLATLGMLAGLAAGCRSDKPVSSGFASVLIDGNTPGQISETAIEVFEAEGYKALPAGTGKITFEREGSFMNNLSYGNWVGDTPVWVRVRVQIVNVGEAKNRLQCQAFLVRDHGTTTDEEIRVSNFRSGPYQKLLDEVARRLGCDPNKKKDKS